MTITRITHTEPGAENAQIDLRAASAEALAARERATAAVESAVDGNPQVCDNCELPTDNTPEDGDVLCDACSPDAFHAAEVAAEETIGDEEHARIQSERDAQDAEMGAAITREA